MKTFAIQSRSTRLLHEQALKMNGASRSMSSQVSNKLLSHRVTPPAPLVLALAPKGPNIAPKWCQHGAKNLQNRAKMGPEAPKWSQNGDKMGSRQRKNERKTPTHQKRGLDLTASPLLSRTSGQHGALLGPKLELKSI